MMKKTSLKVSLHFSRLIMAFFLMLLFHGGASAVQLTPEQLSLVKSLSPAEKASLAKQAGISVSSKGTENHHRPQVASGVKRVPMKPEGTSAIEAQYNRRLTSHAFHEGAGAEDVQNPLGPNRQEQELREVIAKSVGGHVRMVRQTLRQFGYSLFTEGPRDFMPETEIPVPPEYVIGPGDELQIQYYGSRNDSMSLIVDREGMIELPDVGPISLAGLSFMQAKAELSQKIRKSLIGVTASITMGRLRSIRVFVLGDARRPGSYLVSGLSTMTNALFLAGGVSKKGSLRHILLKRDGKTIRDLDLYDFLLRGNSSGDLRLMPGDVIFIPPIGRTVAVAGEAVRPAIYELRGEKTVQDIIRLAGGLMPSADTAHVQVDRLDPSDGRTILDIRLGKKSLSVHNGDLVVVYPRPAEHHHVVTLLGQVKRPGAYGFKQGMRLGDLIHGREDLKKDAFLDYVLIQRTNPKDRTLQVIRAPLASWLERHDPKGNVPLQDEDKVIVLAKSAIQPIESVNIAGEVVSPGTYPLSEGMRVVDLVLAAGGVTDRAYLRDAEVTRYVVANGERRNVQHLRIDLAAALAGDQRSNILLKPDDVVTVRRISNWRSAEHVTISGEVRFPGVYPIEEGERLSSVLERAGGFTDKAYLDAAVFIRETIRRDQQQKLEEMAKQMENEIARLEGQTATLSNPELAAKRQATVARAKEMLAKLQKAKASGRLVIQLRDIEQLKGSEFDVSLRDGDSLYIPQRPSEVLVMGQVYNNTALIYQKHLEVDDYIDRAGGLTRFADEDRIYVVHANGVVEPVRGGWHRTKVRPGDAIVVPENVEQFNLLDSALNWSKVLYQLGTAIASMKVIGIL